MANARKKKGIIGILTGGGDVPGLNPAIRAVTVRALSEVRVLTVDQKLLLRRIQEDPSLGFRIIRKLSHRVRELENELLKATRERLADALETLCRTPR